MVGGFDEGNGHKTEDFLVLIYAYFILHNYCEVNKETVKEQKHL